MNTPMSRRLVLAPLLVAVALLTAQETSAQSYPNRTVRIVVPFVAGGAIDVTARRLAEYLAQRFKQQVIVENTVGAGGAMAARRVARSDPDGYTLLFGTTSVYAINPSINPAIGYDPLKDFALIARYVDSPFLLVAHPSVPVKTLAELVAWGKANSGKLNYGSSGVGTPQHVFGEMFKLATGMPMTHVPYKGGGASVQDVIAGHIQILFENPLSLIPLIEDNKVTPLAVTSDARLAQAPDVPTLKEGGVNFSAAILTGVAAPAATPREIVTQLNAAINESLRDKSVLASIAKFGAIPQPGTPEAFSTFIASELKRWGEVARAANIKP